MELTVEANDMLRNSVQDLVKLEKQLSVEDELVDPWCDPKKPIMVEFKEVS